MILDKKNKKLVMDLLSENVLKLYSSENSVEIYYCAGPVLEGLGSFHIPLSLSAVSELHSFYFKDKEFGDIVWLSLREQVSPNSDYLKRIKEAGFWDVVEVFKGIIPKDHISIFGNILNCEDFKEYISERSFACVI